MSYQELMVEIKRLPDEEQKRLLDELAQLLKQKRNSKTDKLGWREGFFKETFGSLSSEPLVREFEGDFEIREPIL
jgi:hypothetical protein